MRLLNAGAGGQRPGMPFINMDTLKSQLAPGTPERINLDQELNYVDHDLLQSWPFPDGHFDGCCLIHVLEHFNCHDAVRVLKEARRVLVADGVLIASVPDATYFWKVRNDDTPANAVALFGEPIHDAGHDSFRSYAAWRHDHVQVFDYSSLALHFLQARFRFFNRITESALEQYRLSEMAPLFTMLNRRKFSLEMVAIK